MTHPEKELTVPQFLTACTLHATDATTGGGTLHTAYTTWCQRAQIAQPLGRNSFYEALRFHRQRIQTKNGRAAYTDCELLPEDQWTLESVPTTIMHNGSIGGFLSDHIGAQPGARTAKAKVHSWYEGWCRDQEFEALPRDVFARALKAAGIESALVGPIPCYLGITFIDESQDSDRSSDRKVTDRNGNGH